jgi:hypothetical protein
MTLPRLSVNNHKAKVNTATFSYKNLLVASSASDGQIILQTSQSGEVVH